MESQRLLEVLRQVLDELDEGVHVVDTAGITVLYNRRMAEMEGLPAESVVGRPVLEVFRFPDPQGSTLLRALRDGAPQPPARQTYFTRAGKAITTVNRTLPLRVGDKVVGAVEIARDVTQVQQLREHLVRRSGPRYTFADIIGESAALRSVVDDAKRAARTHSSVLLVGETGTGKEMFAQSIHHASPRAGGPFVSQNCAALPESLIEGLLFGTVRGAFTGAVDRPGLLEQADGGTLLLDEVQALAPALQAKLLRVLQEKSVRRIGDTRDRPVDVRIIATMNEDPVDAIAAGRLRKDLYYRLGVVTLFLPPLRERREDIPLLAQAFARRYSQWFGLGIERIADDLMRRFLAYDWPGNVRELEHAIEGAMNLAADGDTVLSLHHLPHTIRRRLATVAPDSADAGTARTASVPVNEDAAARPTAGQHRSAWVETEDERPNCGVPGMYGERAGSLRERLAAAERAILAEALARRGGNISATARDLGLTRQNLQYRLRRLGLRPGSTAPGGTPR
jgi:arginine utilization regulatory protein